MTRPSNEKRNCFFCHKTRPIAEMENLMLGAKRDIVKWACTEHELGAKLSPWSYTWTAFTGHCDACHRDFRVSQEAIDAHRRVFPADTERVAAESFTICLSCHEDRDVEGEHYIPDALRAPTPKLAPITAAHLQALEACIEVADPCDDDDTDGFYTPGRTTKHEAGSPSQLHALAVEALAILKGEPRANRGTIVVSMEGGLVQDVYSDMNATTAPAVFVVDFDTEGGRSEYTIELEVPQSSLPEGPVKIERAQCYDWTLNEPDFKAVERLYKAMKVADEGQGEIDKELRAAAEAKLTPRNPDMEDLKQLARWRDCSQCDGKDRYCDTCGGDGSERPETDDAPRVYHCPTCEGLYTAIELTPLGAAVSDNTGGLLAGKTPAGGCPVCGGVCYDASKDIADDKMMEGWSRAFTDHAPTPPQPLDPADTERLNAAIDRYLTRTPDPEADAERYYHRDINND